MKILYSGLLLLLFVTLSPSPLSAQPSFTQAREKMVKEDIEERGVADPKVLQAMRDVPRHLFVSPSLQKVAYADHPLPIGEGQTISQPYVVAYMTEALKLKGNEKVLEIGTGSGYQAAILSKIAGEVSTIEIREGLAAEAAKRLKEMQYANVSVKQADGYFGWPEKGPFDAIMITAAVNHIPPPLLRQVKEGGRLILPLGSTAFFQTLVRVTKKEGKFLTERLIDVRFVPMTGQAEKKAPPIDKESPPP